MYLKIQYQTIFFLVFFFNRKKKWLPNRDSVNWYNILFVRTKMWRASFSPVSLPAKLNPKLILLMTFHSLSSAFPIKFWLLYSKLIFTLLAHLGSLYFQSLSLWFPQLFLHHQKPFSSASDQRHEWYLSFMSLSCIIDFYQLCLWLLLPEPFCKIWSVQCGVQSAIQVLVLF